MSVTGTPAHRGVTPCPIGGTVTPVAHTPSRLGGLSHLGGVDEGVRMPTRPSSVRLSSGSCAAPVALSPILGTFQAHHARKADSTGSTYCYRSTQRGAKWSP